MSAPEVDWSVLRRQLQGQLYTPDERALYDIGRQVFNGRIDRKPAAVARCVGTADVVACVRFCAENDVKITCRGGGHSALGYAVLDDQLVVDLSALQTIEVDFAGRRVKVGAGSQWGQVDLATYERGFAAPGGGCPQVGVAGLTHGGGFGPLARSHGLTIDNLLEAEVVVTRDASVVRASEGEHPDLFWAIRGGGGGNFGIATSFTYRLYPIEGPLAAGTLLFDWGDATRKAFQFFRDWMQSADADRRLTMLPGFAFDGGSDGGAPRPLSLVSMLYNGDWRAGLACIRRVMDEYGAPPPQPGPPLGPMTLPSYNAAEAATAWPGLGQYWKSGFLKNEFPDAAIDTFMSWFEKAPLPAVRPGAPRPGQARSPDLNFGFIETLGGAIAQRSPSDTAFFWRDQLFSFTFIGVFPPGDADLQWRTREWAVAFRRAMEPYFSGGVYVNYVQDDLPDWKHAYYGEHVLRLQKIKREWDPDHLLRFPQDVLQP